MKVEALTTSAPSPGSDIPEFRAGDKLEVTAEQFKKLSAAGAVRSLEPVAPANIEVAKKGGKKTEPSGEAAGDKTAENTTASETTEPAA